MRSTAIRILWLHLLAFALSGGCQHDGTSAASPDAARAADAAAPSFDAAAPSPDAAAPSPDAAAPSPDVPAPVPADAAPPPPDVAPDGPSGPAKLALSVASHDFGWTQQHRPAPDFTFVLTNKGAANSGAPTIAFQGGNRDFAFAVVPSPTGCAGALAPGASCSIVVRYGPEGAGNDGTPDTTSLVVQATPGGTVSAMLIGTPTLSDGLVIAPPHHDFGSAAPGSISAPVTFTLTNTTARTLSGLLYAFDLGVDHPAPPGQGDFLFDASDCMQRAHNTLGPGASCAILVRFQALPGQVGRLRQNWEVYIFNGEAATANVEAGGS